MKIEWLSLADPISIFRISGSVPVTVLLDRNIDQRPVDLIRGSENESRRTILPADCLKDVQGPTGIRVEIRQWIVDARSNGDLRSEMEHLVDPIDGGVDFGRVPDVGKAKIHQVAVRLEQPPQVIFDAFPREVIEDPDWDA
jgi:hypothetical protein